MNGWWRFRAQFGRFLILTGIRALPPGRVRAELDALFRVWHRHVIAPAERRAQA